MASTAAPAAAAAPQLIFFMRPPGNRLDRRAQPATTCARCQRPNRPYLRITVPVLTTSVVSLQSMPPATLDDHRLLASGKVREIYEAGDDRLLMVASDRISTYDVVHPTPIPNKGEVLTGLSVFWFERTQQIVPNHLISYTDVPDEVKGRALLVEKLEMFPVE